MAYSSLLLSTTTTSNGLPGSHIGEPVRADGWYGRVAHVYTIACYVSNLQGTVSFEASLADVPADGDWFPVHDPITFPRGVLSDQQGPGETANLCFSFQANVTWIRARVDQTGSGFVDRILLNQ